jgi:hypothetical protein
MVALVFGPILGFACAPEPPPYPANLRAANASPNSSATIGYTYCRDLESSTRYDSILFGLVAWIAALLAIGSFGAGTFVFTNDGRTHWWTGKRGSILTLASVPVGLLAFYWFTRSDSGATAAGASYMGMAATSDPVAYESCLAAAAIWDTSVQGANSIAVAGLRRQIDQVATTASAAALTAQANRAVLEKSVDGGSGD